MDQPAWPTSSRQNLSWPPAWLARAAWKRPGAALLCGFALLCSALLIAPQALPAMGAIRHIANGAFLVAGDGGARYREDDLLIPASTIKILTALISLELLGADFRFHTDIFLSHDNTLYIRGGGDPGLTSEVVRSIAATLHGKGLREVQAIVLDTSTFRGVDRAPGATLSLHPYDATNGSLVVNFNTLPISIAPNGTISSSEAQTPLLPIMAAAVDLLPAGRHRLNVASVPVQGDLSPALRLVGELFSTLLKELGVNVAGGCREGQVPDSVPLLHRHTTPQPLEETIRACLQYSNNFIANQLFLACGLNRFGPPATWEKAQRTATEYIATRLHLSDHQLHLEEGSGLSRANLVSATALLRILEEFRPFRELLPHKRGMLLKSGTLSGVFCYAGYFLEPELKPFVILLNQSENLRDEVLAALAALEKGQP